MCFDCACVWFWIVRVRAWRLCRVNETLDGCCLLQLWQICQQWGFSVCGICYEYPVAYQLPGYCPTCPPPPPCPECTAIMTMTTPYHPRPPRPSTLPGLHECRGRQDGPGYAPAPPSLPPALTTPVHMHPDPQDITNNAGSVFFYINIYISACRGLGWWGATLLPCLTYQAITVCHVFLTYLLLVQCASP